MPADRIVFLFPGQGAYINSVLPRLSESWKQVAAVFEAIDATCAEAGVAPVGNIVRDPRPHDLDELVQRDPEGFQLVLFGTCVAAFEIYRALGLRPFRLIGHSLGEIAALCCGGAFTVGDGARIVQARNRALRGVCSGEAGMMALAVSADRARAFVEVLDDPLVRVACHNAPRQCVLSGPRPVLDRARAVAESLGIAATALAASYPFHNSMLAPAVERFEQEVGRLPQQVLSLPVYSPIYGRLYDDADDLPRLVARHLVRPVDMVNAVRAAHAGGAEVFIECGAGDTLVQLVRRTVPAVTMYAPLAAAATVQAALAEMTDKLGRPQEPAPEPVAPPRAEAARGSGRAEIVGMLREIYATTLGYPPEVFEEDSDLEADLGVDSVRQTELLMRVATHFGLASESRAVASYPTFGDVADLVLNAGIAPQEIRHG